ncbi:MAG: hypothetical protein PVJ72_09200 [Gammaproteobacteria bacterium]|jgi:hypothetical protein
MDTQNLYTNLYITHANEELLSALSSALAGVDLDYKKAQSFGAQFSPNGEQLVDELFKHKYVNEFDFEEDAEEEHGYIVFHLEQGEWGDSGMVHFIDFLYALIPGIHAQAWGYAENDPWEFFVKYEDGRAIKQEHVPWEDEQMDTDALEYIYKWWHDDMPDEIEAGLLSDDDEDEDEDDDDDFDEDDFDDENYDD